MKKRMRNKLRQIAEELRRRLHQPVAAVGAYLRSVVGGWLRCYAVPLTSRDLSSFRRQVVWLWRHTMRRRSQKGRVRWDKITALARRWLPPARILHPYPNERLCVNIQGKSRMR